MSRSFLLGAVLLALGCVSGCEKDRKRETSLAPPAIPGGEASPGVLKPEEALAFEAVGLLNRATALLNSIRDDKSAAAVAPELKSIAVKLQDLNRRGVPLGSQVQEKPQALGRYRGQMEKAVQHFGRAAVRVQDPENLLGPEFHDALGEFAKLPE
jgi:hypothetical protein